MCCSIVVAQSGAGSIQGTITDSTGAVIQSASVQVVNQATGLATNTKSNSVGFYSVPGLFTGTYSVTVTAPGMRSYETSIELLVAQNAVINPALTAGSVTEQVEVAANAVQLTTTDSGTITSTLENDRINQLPMNGRILANLAGMTTPGLEGSGQRANGLMQAALEYVSDGVPLSNRQFGGVNQNLAQLPDPDAVQEVRVETTDSSAQYATPGTAIITTKSGTNSLHGTFFETARNNAIGVARSRSNPSNYAAPHLVRNEFGASAGGPVILPHVSQGKDKTFWFYAFEKYSLASYTDELVTVPTMAMRQGDFSGLINSSGVLQQLYDPSTTGPAPTYTRTPFTNNKIPLNRLSPTSKMIFDIIPQPGTTANPLVTTNLSTPNINNEQIPTNTFRIDHSFNENNRAYLRFTDNIQTYFTLRNYPSNSPATIAADGFPAAASGLGYNPTSTFAAAIGFTHVFSPTFFAETIVSQQWFGQHNFAGGTPLADFETKLGIPNNFGEPGFPNFGANLICPLGGTMFVYGLSQIIDNYDENFSKTLGRHQFQFGGRYRHERFDMFYKGNSDNTTFSNEATGLEQSSSGTNYSTTPNTGYADADMFLGAASSYSVSMEPPDDHFHDMEFDVYAQDNFHVTRNLTVNIGLRYEAHPGVWVKNGLNEGFDWKNKAVVLPDAPSWYIAHGFSTQAIQTNMENLGVVYETPAEAGMPNNIQKNFNLTFGPRVGIAYQPFGGKHGTVVRAAYGRYIYPTPVRNFVVWTLDSNEPFETGYSQSYTAASQSPDGLANYLVRNPQTVVMGVNSANVVNSTAINAVLPGNFGVYSFDPDYAPDFVTQTNFTIEQPLKGNSVLRLTWLWSHGTNLDQYYEPNYHPSTYAWEMNTGTAPPGGYYSGVATGPYDQTTYTSSMARDQKTGWSNDNALQVNYQRLFHHGIAYQATYVWSKPLRVGGNWSSDSTTYTAQSYVGASGTLGTMTEPYGTVIAPALPPARPAGIASYAFWHGLDVFENYHVDTAIPKQHITLNGIVDLPVGRGKRFLGNSNRFVDELVGGFQLAGDGSIASQDFMPTATNWGPTNPLKIYKHKAPIMDCRSGTCYKAYEWFNGYLAPTVIPANSSNANCTLASGLVTGLPSDWAPYQSPSDTDCNKNDAAYKYYGQNEVQVALSNGSTTAIPYSPGQQGSNPFSQTVLNGPFYYTVDFSLFKVFPITEKANLRFNLDAFNALNVQGYNNPDATTGIEAVAPGGVGANSKNTPRQLQFTLRFTF
jgi:hypothetical protein